MISWLSLEFMVNAKLYDDYGVLKKELMHQILYGN